MLDDSFVENIADTYYQISLGCEPVYPAEKRTCEKEFEILEEMSAKVLDNIDDKRTVMECISDTYAAGLSQGFINGFKCAVALMQRKTR